MTREEVYEMMKELKVIFDIVRLVDVAGSDQYSVSAEGEIVREPGKCYAVWCRENRCDNCISSKAFAQKAQMTKFEFIKDKMYFVTSKYVEIDGKSFMLEMVSSIKDDIFLGAYGEKEFPQKLVDYSHNLYTDPLTGVRNRSYYDEQVSPLDRISAIAVMDADRFRAVNATYGHHAGDRALQKTASCIRSCIRSSDTIVRYEEDEFVLVFIDITYDQFRDCLEKIRSAVEHADVEGYPELHFTVSIGGYFTDRMSPAVLKRARQLLGKAKETCNAVVTEECVLV